MPTIELNLPQHAYAIHIEPGALARLGRVVRELAPHLRAAIIADEALIDTHAAAAAGAMQGADYEITLASMPAGEQHKTLATVASLYDTLLDAHLERRSPIVALGGGIVGDTAGFVAATYLRGVPLVQCPTTLLAMVDASVGGKVGVNVPQGKNLIGAFHQPLAVVIDTDTLQTLPSRELRAGLAECVKHAVIRDPGLFDWLEANVGRVLALESEALVELVERNVAIKAGVVADDEKETGVRAHLNFGHTFAHAIEAGTAYDAYLHGEAVSLGMLAAARLAAARGLCEPELPVRLERLLGAIELPTTGRDLPAPARLIEIMRHDKKVADGRIRLVLPTGMGAVKVVDDATERELARAWEGLNG